MIQSTFHLDKQRSNVINVKYTVSYKNTKKYSNTNIFISHLWYIFHNCNNPNNCNTTQRPMTKNTDSQMIRS